MKKILAALLAGVLAFSAAACSTPESSTSSAAGDTASQAETASEAEGSDEASDGELPKGTGVSLTVYSLSLIHISEPTRP